MNLFRAALLLSTAALSASAQVSVWTPSLTTTAEWNSNATNSDRDTDVISALQLRADLDAFSRRIALGHDDALVLGAGGRVEYWPRFDDLNQFSLGPQAAWRHKFGLGALAPVVSVELEADAVMARDSDRSGWAGRAALVGRQRLDEATQISLSYARTRLDANESVYARTGGEAAVEVTREVNEDWQVALAARWREGDVVSYATPPRPDLVALARVRVMVDTFGAPRVAYSLSARTLGGSVALTRRLDDRSSITFAYEGRVTERSPLRYVNHLVSTAFTRQF